MTRRAQRQVQELLALARELLNGITPIDASTPFTVHIVSGPSVVLRSQLQHPMTPPPNPMAASLPPPERPPLQRDILRILSNAPKQPKTLARLSNHTFNSYFRQALQALVRDGLAERLASGYRLHQI